MDYSAVEVAMGDKLKEVVGAIPIKWPNLPEPNPEASPRLLVEFSYTTPAKLNLGTGRGFKGMMHIRIKTKLGEGNEVSSDLATQIIEGFAPNQNVGPVRIEEVPYQVGGMEEPGSWVVPVTVPFEQLKA